MAIYVSNQKKRLKKGPIIIGIIVILGLLVGGGVFFMSQNGDEKTPDTQTEQTQTEGSTTQSLGTLPADAFPIQVTNE
ncbi:MAG: hypothetical protein ACRDAO_04985 [Culicoidibacterales bacterium]